MGEVYRARDTRLDRDVAVKMLSSDVSSDPDRLARLTREARLLAALNHPHIAAIHEFEEADGMSASSWNWWKDRRWRIACGMVR